MSTTVECSGNVVVRGILRMRPNPDVTHTLRFVGVEESRVVGGGHEPLASDVGLWVVDDGQLDLQGTPKAGWNRIGADRTWAPSDELKVAPIRPGDYTGFAPFAVGSTVPYVEHDGVRYNSEVLNLSRNVRVEGTPTGRAHIMLTRARRPQTIRHAVIRHMGPKAGDVGRYGLHFHHCGDGVRGSLVEGVVVRDCGNHAFVPHGSHGITFRDCIALNVGAHAYWWDPEPSRFDYPTNASFDITYDRCVATKIYPRGGLNEHTLTGFYLGQGEGNACLDCVAVGVEGKATTSGFHWPSQANLQPNVWRFQRGIAHNNKVNGVYVWQNGAGDERHPIDGLSCFHNGRHGVEHGAYANSYDYKGLRCFGNGMAPVLSHANAQTIGQFWRAPNLDASGKAYALWIGKHRTEHGTPVTFIDARLRGYAIDAVLVDEVNTPQEGRYDFVRCLAGDRDLAAADFKIVKMHPDSVYRVQRRDGTAFRLRPDGTATAIPAFA